MNRKTYTVTPYQWTDVPWDKGLFEKTRMVRDLTVEPEYLKELLEEYNE